MADHVTLNQVRTWYETTGDGEPLVLLHGGFSDARDFAGNLDRLPFRLYTPERRGHGHTADVDGPITLDLMAADTIAFVDSVVGGPVHLAGYSAGAMVALLVALRRPDVVRRLVLVSGAFHHTGLLSSPASGGEPPEPLVARYAEVSPDGRDHFPVVAAKLAAAATNEPSLTQADLRTIGCPALVLAADDDLVTLEHTLALYRALPAGELAVVPGTSHLLLHEKPALCARLVEQFLAPEPTPVLLPIRRAARR